MARGKKTISPLKDFDAGYLFNPNLCKVKLVAKGVPEKQMIELFFKGINMGKHVGWKL
ncbi:MAG: hypothetical protein RTU92_08610 [Candidatus Thorarchaeota archaeon]